MYRWENRDSETWSYLAEVEQLINGEAGVKLDVSDLQTWILKRYPILSPLLCVLLIWEETFRHSSLGSYLVRLRLLLWKKGEGQKPPFTM